ncbi:UDP-N-acetylmuramoyl-L-alanyl-D-glutamate--2,6-diaminopimelate ligase [Planctomycetota bacterium]|nr:UDP-N-acetylmuramoyl-L-alanyl-D-glutamate--2,6-diaminopimelate ligase [Planctomycetota bacterium]
MPTSQKQLRDIIADLDLHHIQGSLDIPITDITDDSRRITPGSLFIVRSWAHDGASIIGSPGGATRSFIQDAVVLGATAIIDISDSDITVYDAHLPEPIGRPVIPPSVTLLTTQPNTKIDQAFAGRIADKFFDNPSSKLKLLGITGTNGKTTTGFITQHLLKYFGNKTGLIGTVHIDTGSGIQPTELTTPGAIDIRRILAQMVDAGCTAAVMEVSSHALHQRRAEGLHFDAAIFTNLSGDHLDFHPDMNSYAAAKAMLFESLDESSWAILNADDHFARRMAQSCSAKQIWTSTNPDFQPAKHTHHQSCHVNVTALTIDGTTARYTGPWGSFSARLPLIGRYNAINAIQAVAALNVLSLPSRLKSRHVRKAIEQTPGVPGRLEQVFIDISELDLAVLEFNEMHMTLDPFTGLPEDSTEIPHELPYPTVLVDYSHTDDSLENALLAVRPLALGRVITVFGCGGDRDISKRPRMGSVAAEYSDIIVITSDNPRSEDPQTIINDIMPGISIQELDANVSVEDRIKAFESEGGIIELDRAKAIHRAILIAEPEDVVLIAGKGHETYQVLRQQDVTDPELLRNATPSPKGTLKIHFDDREQARKSLKQWATRFYDSSSQS